MDVREQLLLPQAQPQVTEGPSDMAIDICMCLLQTTFPIATTQPLCVAGVGQEVQPFHSSSARDSKHHLFSYKCDNEYTANGCQHSHHKANTHDRSTSNKIEFFLPVVKFALNRFDEGVSQNKFCVGRLPCNHLRRRISSAPTSAMRLTRSAARLASSTTLTLSADVSTSTGSTRMPPKSFTSSFVLENRGESADCSTSSSRTSTASKSGRCVGQSEGEEATPG